MKIKVALCDDHPLIIEGLQRFISSNEKMEITAKVSSVSELMETLENVCPDVLIMDISLPDGNGIEACREVKRKYRDIKIIGLSSFEDRETILQMINSGASGYLVKSASAKELETAVEAVYEGGVYFGSDAQKALNQFYVNTCEAPPVTRREKEVLLLLSEGYSSVEIGEKIFISPQTVDTHRKNLMKKFGVNKTLHLIAKAKEMGIIG